MHHCIKFILFWDDILPVSDGFSVHHQEGAILRRGQQDPPKLHVVVNSEYHDLAGSSKTTSAFYVYGSVHRQSILIIVQRDATQTSPFIILQVRSTCFGREPHPSSGVHKTVTAVSGTGHIFCAAASLQCGTLEGGSYTAQYDQYRRL